MILLLRTIVEEGRKRAFPAFVPFDRPSGHFSSDLHYYALLTLIYGTSFPDYDGSAARRRTGIPGNECQICLSLLENKKQVAGAMILAGFVHFGLFALPALFQAFFPPAGLAPKRGKGVARPGGFGGVEETPQSSHVFLFAELPGD